MSVSQTSDAFRVTYTHQGPDGRGFLKKMIKHIVNLLMTNTARERRVDHPEVLTYNQYTEKWQVQSRNQQVSVPGAEVLRGACKWFGYTECLRGGNPNSWYKWWRWPQRGENVRVDYLGGIHKAVCLNCTDKINEWYLSGGSGKIRESMQKEKCKKVAEYNHIQTMVDCGK